jgi:hypothetical protein
MIGSSRRLDCVGGWLVVMYSCSMSSREENASEGEGREQR